MSSHGRRWRGERLALAPLERLAGSGASRVAATVGITHTHVYRLRRTGLSPWQADELACAAGLHPAEVWGDDWWRLDDHELSV